MIYTLTMNTAIDMNIRCQEILPNLVNRTDYSEYSPNGKAINVSILLHHFARPTTAIGFFAGFSGQYIYDGIKNMDIPVIPCWVDGVSRINIFINDGKNEYKLVDKGPIITLEKQAEMLEIINNLANNSYLVISGSVPQNIADAYYDDILTICNKKNINVILDISIPKLQDLLAYQPLLIKPNDDELEAVFGLSTNNQQAVIASMAKLHQLGARNILLTMGANGLYFSNNQHLWFCDSVKIKLVSSACAGDACLGSFLSEWLYHGEVDLALRKASATGANVAESDGLGKLDKIAEYMQQLTVTQIY